MKLLIIEDDKYFAKTLKNQLKPDYAVDLAFSSKDGEHHAKAYDYDLIILDVGLPDNDGISLCAQLRRNGIKSPILMLTGEFAVNKKVAALDSGADDYLIKPFHISELQARLRALLRRKAHAFHAKVLTLGDLRINLADRTVKRGKQDIVLQRKEFQMLEYFMKHPGTIISRDTLIEHLWDSDAESCTNIIDVHIKYLRDHIDRPFSKKLIKTIYGLGYKLDV
ncbi:MAG TPA: response regulator transcription factor [Patescibacteria group bacterium]|nr:response regulator transcription factor [Patescibacteria group bacterium]